MPRKQLKLKKRSCPMCKPHKMRGDTRWKPKVAARIRRDEADICEACKKDLGSG